MTRDLKAIIRRAANRPRPSPSVTDHDLYDDQGLPVTMTDWEEDCLQWRGRVLTGRDCHWCAEWDDLPMDETCPEWPCGCEGHE